mmetsp:Transcript_58555/g.156750  ORF Transcript_58555/g.156750 Transcript_58555/m.156750 type:complete len:267 (+) Transcript_58555:404-1204(+)
MQPLAIMAAASLGRLIRQRCVAIEAMACTRQAALQRERASSIWTSGQSQADRGKAGEPKPRWASLPLASPLQPGATSAAASASTRATSSCPRRAAISTGVSLVAPSATRGLAPCARSAWVAARAPSWALQAKGVMPWTVSRASRSARAPTSAATVSLGSCAASIAQQCRAVEPWPTLAAFGSARISSMNLTAQPCAMGFGLSAQTTEESTVEGWPLAGTGQKLTLPLSTGAADVRSSRAAVTIAGYSRIRVFTLSSACMREVIVDE